VTDNQNKVSFMFGQYSQDNSRLNDTGAGANRFQYITTTMSPSELTVRRALGDDAASERGFQSWQIIYPAWGTLHFDEDASTDAVCTATLTGLPKFYASGSTLATELAAAMTAASCTGSNRINTYGVSYDAVSGQFTFTRATGGRNFRIAWGRTPNNIRNALAETSTSTTGWATTFTTDFPRILLTARQAPAARAPASTPSGRSRSRSAASRRRSTSCERDVSGTARRSVSTRAGPSAG
jgi:hypothetical protein